VLVGSRRDGVSSGCDIAESIAPVIVGDGLCFGVVGGDEGDENARQRARGSDSVTRPEMVDAAPATKRWSNTTARMARTLAF